MNKIDKLIFLAGAGLLGYVAYKHPKLVKKFLKLVLDEQV